MADPFKGFTEFQAAWLKAWAHSAQNMTAMLAHMVDMQQKFLSHAAKYHRDHVEIATGPSLTDKYGKRSHDIDPERDV